VENVKMDKNIILSTDSYKPTHSGLYKPGTTYMQSYLESRVDKPDAFNIAFGLQYIMKRFLQGRVVNMLDVRLAEMFFEKHFGRSDAFDKEGWSYIASDLGGKLPIRIWAQPEGAKVPARTPLIVVESTDRRVFWIVNYLETLLCQVWYPMTIATSSYENKNLLRYYLKETSTLEGEALEGDLMYRLHDFGYRGVSSDETAGIGGMAHLTSFAGTDTLNGIVYAREFYDGAGEMYGNSIPASEHSTMTSWGGRQGEADAMENMLDTYPTGAIACVSDSYDIMNAIENIWGDKLKQKVLDRDGVLVVRPDSGDPEVSTIRVVQALWDAFGGEVNDKGYKVLNPKVRMIQGDGIDKDSIGDILHNFQSEGFSTENITFGSGGGLLQKFNRDTYKFAFKCNKVVTNGEEVDVRKKPKEFNSAGRYVQSSKFSKSGDLKDTPGLVKVFENGEILKEWSFDEVRQRIANS
jgi:nicotinamide phosphoribosyltransferase